MRLLFLLAALVAVPLLHAQPHLDALGIAVSQEASRPFLFTNKEAAYLYGEAAGAALAEETM